MQKDQRKRSHAGASTASTHNDEPDVDDCWPLHVPLAVRGGRSTKTEAREIDIWNLPDRPDVPVDDAIGLPQLIGTRKPRKRSSSAPIVVAYGGAEPAEGYFDGGNWGDSRAHVTSGRYARARRAGAQAAHGRSAEEAEPLLRATISEDNNGGVHAAEQETDGEAPPTTCDDMCGGFALGKAGEATAKVRQDKEKKREERWQMRSFRALFARLSFILPALICFGDSMQQSNTCAPVELMSTCMQCLRMAPTVVTCEACCRTFCAECDRAAHATMHQHSRQKHDVASGQSCGLDAEQFITATGCAAVLAHEPPLIVQLRGSDVLYALAPHMRLVQPC